LQRRRRSAQVLNRGLQCYEAVLRGCLLTQDLAFTGFGIARAEV
jgi:hypothetical protein